MSKIYTPFSFVVTSNVFPLISLTRLFVSTFNSLTFIFDKVLSLESFCPFAFSSYQATPVIVLFPWAISLSGTLLSPSSTFPSFDCIIWLISDVLAISSPYLSAVATFVIASDSSLSAE